MKKTFNTTGRCFPEEHFMVDISAKFAEVVNLIDSKKYFAINRPRQYGKTTMLHLVKQYYRKKEDFLVIQTSFEGIGDSPFETEHNFCKTFIELLAEYTMLTMPEDGKWLLAQAKSTETLKLMSLLISDFIKRINKKVLLLIDEVDKSSNNQLFVAFLAMLRDKYLIRDDFPTFHSVILAGVYDVKTLKLKLRPDAEKKFNSPWNIAVEFDVQMEFSEAEILPMLQDYQQERSIQVDTEGVAKQLVFYTSGYPFLISKLCQIFDEKILPKKAEKIWTVEDVDKSFQMILREEDNANFDNIIKELEHNQLLYDLLFTIIFDGAVMSYNLDEPLIRLGKVYGVLSRSESDHVVIHNRIYRERIANMMLSRLQVQHIYLNNKVGRDTALSQYRNKNNTLNLELVLQKFEQFMREQRSAKDYDFIERQGRLIFLSFLRPILNGSGYEFKETQISEEQRLDIVITYFQYRYVVELKIWRGPQAHQDGLAQLDQYLDNLGLTEGYLLIFDHNKKRRKKAHWVNFNDKKMYIVFV